MEYMKKSKITDIKIMVNFNVCFKENYDIYIFK